MTSLFKYTRDRKTLFPTTILASLVTHNIEVTDVQMEFIVDIKCQLRILCLEGFLKQDSCDNNFQCLC